MSEKRVFYVDSEETKTVEYWNKLQNKNIQKMANFIKLDSPKDEEKFEEILSEAEYINYRKARILIEKCDEKKDKKMYDFFLYTIINYEKKH